MSIDMGTVGRIHAHRAVKKREADRLAAVERGHTTGVTVHFFDEDDSSGTAWCSCGWQTRAIKVGNARDAARAHERSAALPGTEKPSSRTENS